MARNVIHTISKDRKGCGILDLDFLARFDWLIMSWLYSVLKKKGVAAEVIDRLGRLYENNISIVVVNNILGRAIRNKRQSLRQGDKPSMCWFSVAIDPLIYYLDDCMASH